LFKILKLLLLIIFVNNLLLADELFFDSNLPSNLFSNEVFQASTDNIILMKAKQIEDTQKTQDQIEKSTPLKLNEDSLELNQGSKKLSAKEELVNKYGNPNIDKIVKAQEDSPEPFKAMVESYSRGEKELAYQYARQYVKYISDLKKVTNDVIGLQGQALIQESVLPKGAWPNDQRFKPFEQYRTDIEAEGIPEKGESYEVNIDQESLELLDQLNNDEFKLFDKETSKEEEIRLRAKAKAYLIERIPSFGDVPIDVLFFFDVEDEKSRLAAKELNKLYKFSKNNLKQKYNFAGLSIKKLEKGEKDLFKAKSKIQVPIIEGSVLAKNLKISKTPSYVFISRNDGRSYIESGIRSYFYLEELLKLLEGRK